MSRRLLAPLMVAALALIAGACNSSTTTGTNGAKLLDIDTSVVPTTLNGLPVTHEDVRSTLVKGSDTYLSAAGLFSLRKANVVQATLQISRFNSSAAYHTDKFRTAILNQLGNGSPTSVSVSGNSVYLTTGNKQRVYVWFVGAYMMVLSVRSDYTQPRTLLREAMAVNLQ